MTIPCAVSNNNVQVWCNTMDVIVTKGNNASATNAAIRSAVAASILAKTGLTIPAANIFFPTP